MKIQNFSGYTEQNYQAQFSGVTPRVLLGSGLEARLKFDAETGRPVESGEIESKRLWVYYPGLGVQAVKLPADYSLTKDVEDLAEIELISPEGCIIGSEIYVRAKGVKSK
ncbi:hypothetical protein V3C97_06605 [Ligilactobacillus saerimneri]|uniref:hypothetical protein n=1 Tax=Ligilactobacillus saerimneri TaxID=228229 RepID=UPI0030CD9670